jgi:hypothetical protein
MNKKTRKLSLNRETVRGMETGELRGVQGAAPTDTCTCPRPCSIVSCVTECTQCSYCCP